MANIVKLGQFGHTFKREASAIVRSVQERHHPPGERGEKLWRNLSILGIPLLLLSMYNCFVLHKEEDKRPEPIHYPYLKLMKKPFPWGDGKHTLFHNPKHNWIPGIGYEE